MKIAVAGTGYVGLSIATLLAQHNEVIAVDVIPEKVDMINKRISPIQDEYIEKFFAEKELNLTATLDGAAAYKDAEMVVIAAPTNYDPVKNFFDTHHIEDVIDLVLSVNPEATMVIKSTIPVGYTESIRQKTGSENILFSPEFLRESKALYDNLYPSRIIVGRPEGDTRLEEAACTFANLLKEGAIKEDVDVLFMGLTEAEAVKLFANTYLALQQGFYPFGGFLTGNSRCERGIFQRRQLRHQHIILEDETHGLVAEVGAARQTQRINIHPLDFYTADLRLL